MSEEKITTISTQNDLAIITINNPPVNTISTKTIAALNESLDTLEADKKIKAIVLRGANGHFMAGAELKEFNEIETKPEGSKVSYLGHHLMNRIERFHKPIIALIEGACLGGGLELALACHIRIGTADSQYGFPEITLGLIPGAGGTQRLPRAIGIGRARYLILSGERVTAEEAERIGMIDWMIQTDNALDNCIEFAEAITKNSRVALEKAMDALNSGLFSTSLEGYNREIELFGECFETYDKKEGVRAFLERRKPNFQNR